jgi:DUF917 family protein
MAFLGSGGGGAVQYARRIVESQISQNGDVNVMSLSELENDDLVLGMAYVGAPLVWLERLPSLQPIVNLLRSVEAHYKQSVKALFPLEIGGANGLCPFYIASLEKLPILDGDLLGRAFPEMQMISTNIMGIPISLGWMSDAFGNIHTIEPKDYVDLEQKARALCVQFGSSSLFVCSFYKKDIEKAFIAGTLSKALHLGRCIFDLSTKARILIKGFITDCPYEVIGGFLRGSITIETPEGYTVNILLQNEFMVARDDKSVLARCPDIISFIDLATGDVVSSEHISIGKWVYVLSTRGPDIWYTPNGLSLIGEIK